MAIFIAAALLGGVALSALAAHKKGKEANRTAEVNSALIQRDAQLMAAQADQTIRDLEQRANQLRGSSVAAAASSGTTLEGSPASILSEQAVTLAIDTVRVEFTRDKKAEGFGIQSRDQRRRGRAAKEAATLAVAGTVLGGAAQAFGSPGVVN